MKNMNKYLIFLIALLAVGIMSFKNQKTAAPSRLGFVSVFNLVSQIPEYTAKKGSLDTLIYEFNVELQTKMQEYQAKEMAYVKDSISMNAVIKESKLQELQALGQAIQAFKQTSEEAVVKQDSAMLQPILKQLNTAMEAVAKEQGYTQIINSDVRSQSGTALVLYSQEDEALTADILAKYNAQK